MNSLNYFLGILFAISITALVLAILPFTKKKGDGFTGPVPVVPVGFCQMCAKDPNYDGGKCVSNYTNRCGYGIDPYLDACQNAGKLGSNQKRPDGTPGSCTSDVDCGVKSATKPFQRQGGKCIFNAVCINQHTKGKCT